MDALYAGCHCGRFTIIAEIDPTLTITPERCSTKDLQRRGVDKRAGAVDQDVDPSEGLECLLVDVLDLVTASELGSDENGCGSILGELGDGLGKLARES